ncbi:hypothetical protein T06_5959 [Trichinella sp. T6]|nr:hypothetical protein T06_5959 [Trichinella sp. T6]
MYIGVGDKQPDVLCEEEYHMAVYIFSLLAYQDYLNGVLLLFRKTNVQNDYKINYNGMLLRLSLMANLSSNERRQRRFIRLLLFS